MDPVFYATQDFSMELPQGASAPSKVKMELPQRASAPPKVSRVNQKVSYNRMMQKSQIVQKERKKNL